MKPSTKRHLEYCAIGCVVLAAVGLRVGIYLVDHVEVFMPGATLRTLWRVKPGGAK
jgi:acyl dehydratase